MKNKINLFSSIIFFLIFQYFMLNFVSARVPFSFSLYIGILSILFSIIAFLFYINSIHFLFSLSLFPLLAGAFISYTYTLAINAYFFYYLSAILGFLGLIMNEKEKKFSKEKFLRTDLFLYFFLLFYILISIILPYLADKYLMYKESFILHYFPLRSRGIGSNDVPAGQPFNNYFVIIPAILTGCLSLLFFYFVIKEKIKKTGLILLTLVGLAFIIKPAIANMSGFGIKVMPIKAAAKINTTFYFFAKQYKDNIIKFVNDYVNMHQPKNENSHLKGHPPAGVVFYWIVGNLAGFNDMLVALIYSLIISFTVIPLYIFTINITKNKIAGVFASLLYAFTPNSAILSVAGTDGLVVFLISFSLIFIIKYLESFRKMTIFIAGFIWGIASGVTFGIWALLPFIFLFMMTKIYMENNKDILDLIKKIMYAIIFFILGLFLYHFIFYLIFPGFNYFKSFKIAKDTIMDVMDISSRPVSIWVWLNFIHWSEYATAAATVLFFYRFFKRNAFPLEAYSIMSLFTMVSIFLSIMGRGEQHRQWMYLIIFLIPVAATSLINNLNGKWIFDKKTAIIFLIIAYLQTIIIEILISDTL